MTPVILVKSFDTKTAYELIANILKANGETPKEQPLTIESNSYKSYPCNIKTKYYETTVYFVACEHDLGQLSPELLKDTEAFIGYVNGADRSVLKTLTEFSEALKVNRIELNMLLTDKLTDDAALGVTYKELKSIANVFFDVIELSDTDDRRDDGDDDDDQNDDREEVLEALRNHIWSTVKVPSQLDGDDDDDFDSDAENQIQAFESLLNNIQNFKKVSSTLDREQVLDQAEKLAELFANIMNED